MLIPAFAARLLPRLARDARLRRQSIAASVLLLASACADTPNLGEPGFVQGFAGAAVADEPNAALVGRDLLAAGGSAGDAAAGMFFALAVSKPASGGLMASGECLAYNPTLDLHQAYGFQTPEGVRAVAAIHARFGLLPWRQVVGSAEAMARFGTRLSKAFVEDWKASPPPAGTATDIYGAEPAVGDKVRNVGLASLLRQIRLNGAGAFYNGLAAKQLWSAMGDAGIPVDQQKWRNAIPQNAESLRVKFGNHDAVFTPFGNSTGPAAAAVWPKLEDQGIKALPRLLAEAGAVAPSSATAEASFVAVDRVGGAVACTITMGQPFGTGRMVSGTFMANPAGPSAGPVMITNKPTKVFLAAVSGAGAPGWPSATALETLDNAAALGDALKLPRMAPARAGDSFSEPGGSPSSGTVVQVERLGRVNAVVCLRGLPNYPESCQAAPDPRGRGYAAVADFPG